MLPASSSYRLIQPKYPNSLEIPCSTFPSRLNPLSQQTICEVNSRTSIPSRSARLRLSVFARSMLIGFQYVSYISLPSFSRRVYTCSLSLAHSARPLFCQLLTPNLPSLPPCPHRSCSLRHTATFQDSLLTGDLFAQVICEKVDKSDIATIDKKKYLVPADLTVGQFVYVIRKRIKLAPEKAIFIFVDEVLPPTAALMSSIYEEHKDEDGYEFLPFFTSIYLMFKGVRGIPEKFWLTCVQSDFYISRTQGKILSVKHEHSVHRAIACFSLNPIFLSLSLGTCLLGGVYGWISITFSFATWPGSQTRRIEELKGFLHCLT